MRNDNDNTHVNALIVQYLQDYEKDVQELAIEAVRNAERLHSAAIVEQMAGVVRRVTRVQGGTE